MRGIDQRRFVASMLSVPLTWHDQVVGVLNVQTEEHRDFTPSDVDQLSAIADLLAGIVEKGRLQSEAEAQVEQLKAIDEARAELIAMVTHELRTPLAVVRAYTELLAEEPAARGPRVARPGAAGRRAGWYAGRWTRSSGWTGSSTRSSASVRVGPSRPPTSRPIDIGAGRRRGRRASWRRCSRGTGSAREVAPLLVLADRPPAPDPRAPRRERGEVRAAGDPDRLDWRMAEGGVRIGVDRRRPGHPEEWRERIFEPYARRETHTARGSGIGLYAARRLAESMGARLWCEPAPSGGARFVIALPAAVAV